MGWTRAASKWRRRRRSEPAVRRGAAEEEEEAERRAVVAATGVAERWRRRSTSRTGAEERGRLVGAWGKKRSRRNVGNCASVVDRSWAFCRCGIDRTAVVVDCSSSCSSMREGDWGFGGMGNGKFQKKESERERGR